MLGCIQPISSPMMNRMFGFFSWAAAGAASATAVKPAANTVPTPASRAVTLRTFRLLIFIFSIPLLCETRNKLHEATPRPTGLLARCGSFGTFENVRDFAFQLVHQLAVLLYPRVGGACRRLPVAEGAKGFVVVRTDLPKR